jgi:phage terminase small subunit
MLTRRKQTFIDNYILSLNATKAAELSGYSLKTAYSQGSRLLNNVEVKEVINRRLEEVKAQNCITRESIIQNLWKEALTAQRSADRIAANVALAKIRGDIKDSNTTQVSVFTGDMIKDLPPIDVTPKATP